MFRVKDVILSEEIATTKFACDVSKCKGACCVVGDAGAPVSREEIPVIRKAYNLLKDELKPEARDAVEKNGVVQENEKKGFEITCIENNECIFVTYDENRVAKCAIQKAFYEGRILWEKPISCHLYPVRLKRISGMNFANFEYIENMCGAGCKNGEENGIYLADFLEKALIRRYGSEWYEEFRIHCFEVREQTE